MRREGTGTAEIVLSGEKGQEGRRSVCASKEKLRAGVRSKESS